MLEQIIRRKFYLAQHIAAPLLKERESYLEYLQSKGRSRQYLLSIADYTLRIVQFLDLKDEYSAPVTLSAIETAAAKWANLKLNHPMKRHYSATGRIMFITIATAWLKHIGRIESLFEDSEILLNEIFFKRHVKRKYLSAPFLQERLAYLRQWKDNGSSISFLREIATYQIHIIDYLQLVELHPISESEVSQAAQKWSREKDIYGRVKEHSLSAEMHFLRFAKGWLSSMGLLVKMPINIPFENYMMQYLNDLLNERGYSPRTIEGRYSQLKIFLKEVGGKCSDLMELSPSMIDTILCKRYEEGKCSRVTIAETASIYRSFLRYAASQGWCRQGLAETVKAPRVYHLDSLPSSPPRKVIQKIIEEKNTDNPADIRNYALLLLLAVYGLRCSEITGLKLTDIDWKNEQLHLRRAKGCKPQIFPLLKTVGDSIIRYIKEVRQNKSHSEYLFLCRRAPYRPMSTSAIYLIVSHSLKGYDLDIKHYGPHSLRHGCATHLINSGFSLKEIADQLGHQQLDTTRIYAKVDLSNLRKVAEINWEGLL
jgi:site-specific recombinase XerD